MCRARQRQLLIALAWRCTFVGLLLACAAVLAVRLGVLPLDAITASITCLLVSFLAGVVSAWRNWPETVAVAIEADIALGLKQRLSTACELSHDGADPGLVERLARQVLRRRLPGRLDDVFPARITALGKLTPVALLALALVASIETPARSPASSAPVDELVIDSGARLRDFGRRMQASARAGQLTRSTEQGRKMQALGERMQRGQLNRQQALTSLRGLDADMGAEQRSLLPDDQPQGLQPLTGGNRGAQGANNATLLRTRLQAAANDAREATDLQASDIAQSELQRWGVSRADLQAALQAAREGDGQALEQIANQLADGERALRDAQTLGDGRDAVNRARRRLGDDAAGESGDGAADDADQAASDPGAMDLPGERPGDQSGDGGDPHEQLGGGYNPDGSDRNAAQGSTDSRPRGRGELLRPRSQPGEGELRRAQIRSLPRINEANIERQAGNVAATRRDEAALARESYPPRYKELVRRYFLELNGQQEDKATRE